MEIINKESNITFDSILKGSFRIYQQKEGYRVGTDAILLAASINPIKGRLIDLGAGVGTLSIIIARKNNKIKIDSIEKDFNTFKLLSKNIKFNQLEESILPVYSDIKDLPTNYKGCFDHVISNPPFYRKNKKISFNNPKNLGYYDENITIMEWIEISSLKLKNKGRITIIISTERMDEVIVSLKKCGVGEIIIFPIWSFFGDKSIRVIISGRKGVTSGMAILSGLVLYKKNGSLTDEAQKVMDGSNIFLKHPNAQHINY